MSDTPIDPGLISAIALLLVFVVQIGIKIRYIFQGERMIVCSGCGKKFIVPAPQGDQCLEAQCKKCLAWTWYSNQEIVFPQFRPIRPEDLP